MTTQPKVGLLLSGGAARGAFQAGVVSAFSQANVQFQTVLGTSIGAVNGAAFLLGYGPELVNMWKDHIRDVPWIEKRNILRGRNPFQFSEGMRVMVSKYSDVEKIRSHPTEMLISTTEWGTSKNVLFSSHDPIPWTEEEVVLQFMASMTIPGVCSEKIVIRGTRYCDGALSKNMPIDALIERGCKKIVIVDPSPNADTRKRRFFERLSIPLTASRFQSFRVVGGILKALTELHPKTSQEAVEIIVIQPEPELLTTFALDFTKIEHLDKACDAGFRAGRAVLSQIHAPLSEPC
jgi:predicted acylesterase/phospholipase RssA